VVLAGGEAVSVKSRLEETVRMAHSPDHEALLELVEALLAEDDDCVVSIRTARALTRVLED